MLCRQTLLRLQAVASARCWASTEVTCKRFEDKVAVITGSTDGIGFATAERMAKEGAKVVISSRKQQNVDEAVKRLTDQGLTATGITCSVGRDEDREKLLEHTLNQFGGLDVLVCNAAISPGYGPILKAKKKLWDSLFEVNVTSTFLLSQAAVPEMIKRGGGSIVYIGSVGSFWRAHNILPYTVSKTALLGLVKAMAVDCVEHNIRVNAIIPGCIGTNFAEGLHEDKEFMEIFNRDALMKRFGNPEEVANAVAFIASDEASYITAESLAVGGGLPSRL